MDAPPDSVAIRMSSAAHAMPTKLDILRDVFGFGAFRPGQEQAMDAVLAGRNVLSVMPTGSGKSLCFQVPALMLGGLTIVVSPLVALMQDQVAALKLAGVAADTINSSRDRDDNVAAWRRAASGQTRLLYLSPERLMTAQMLAALAKLPVRLIAVDEAHCISQWGPAFRPDYEALSRLRDAFPRVPIMALTATADESTRADIAAQLFAGHVEPIVLGFDRPNIKLTVAPKQGWKQQLLAFVKARPGKSGIVYCLSRKRTEEAAALLAAEGIKALAYHAGMTKEMREAQPERLHDRALHGDGRDDRLRHGHRQGRCALRVPCRSAGERRELLSGDRPRRPRRRTRRSTHALRPRRHPHAPAVHRSGRIERRAQAARTSAARRAGRIIARPRAAAAASCSAISAKNAEPCGHCDLCLNPPDLSDGTEHARRVLDIVQRTGERYGAGHIVDVLCGVETEKTTTTGHSRLRIFGSGAALKKTEWRSLIRQLVAGGFLHHDVAGFGGLSLSDEGRALLRGQGQFQYRAERPRETRRERDRRSRPRRSRMRKARCSPRLKKLRLSLAAERHLPAYLIFSDKTLAEMARAAPAISANSR